MFQFIPAKRISIQKLRRESPHTTRPKTSYDLRGSEIVKFNSAKQNLSKRNNTEEPQGPIQLHGNGRKVLKC